jgi:hypothetical protein
MQQIIQYKAYDGTMFSDESKCTTYEQQCLQIDDIMKFMGQKPKDNSCIFANGGGYIPHNMEKVKAARTTLMELGMAILDIKKAPGEYMIGRHFDDSNNKALYSAWSRLWCCDEQGREWGQSYFAHNPTKGTQEIFIDGQ